MRKVIFRLNWGYHQRNYYRHELDHRYNKRATFEKEIVISNEVWIFSEDGDSCVYFGRMYTYE